MPSSLFADILHIVIHRKSFLKHYLPFKILYYKTISTKFSTNCIFLAIGTSQISNSTSPCDCSVYMPIVYSCNTAVMSRWQLLVGQKPMQSVIKDSPP